MWFISRKVLELSKLLNAGHTNEESISAEELQRHHLLCKRQIGYTNACPFGLASPKSNTMDHVFLFLLQWDLLKSVHVLQEQFKNIDDVTSRPFDNSDVIIIFVH